MSAATRRLNKEVKDLIDSPIEGCTVSVSDEDILDWTATVGGPAGSPYEGGKFVVSLTFPKDFPFKGPKAEFKTKIFHPNVGQDGKVCLDVLNAEKWAASTKVGKILLALVSLLAHPDSEHPLQTDIGELLQKDSDKFNETAKEWTQKHAV